MKADTITLYLSIAWLSLLNVSNEGEHLVINHMKVIDIHVQSTEVFYYLQHNNCDTHEHGCDLSQP